MLFRILTILTIVLMLGGNLAYAEEYQFGSRLCGNPNYHCFTVRSRQSWESLWPNARERDLVMRVNRRNLPLYPGMTVAVPNNLSSADALEISPFLPQISPPGKKLIVVELSRLAWGAYDAAGNLVYWGPAAGGKAYCPDENRRCRSPVGEFNVFGKNGFGCISTKFPVPYGGAKMPYCMYFHGGFALHGSYEVPGFNASHGCIRMFIEDAKWLNEEFVNMGTRVIIRPYY